MQPSLFPSVPSTSLSPELCLLLSRLRADWAGATVKPRPDNSSVGSQQHQLTTDLDRPQGVRRKHTNTSKHAQPNRKQEPFLWHEGCGVAYVDAVPQKKTSWWSRGLLTERHGAGMTPASITYELTLLCNTVWMLQQTLCCWFDGVWYGDTHELMQCDSAVQCYKYVGNIVFLCTACRLIILWWQLDGWNHVPEDFSFSLVY